MSTVHPPRTTAEALLSDGTTVEIRQLGPQDHQAVLDLNIDGMSEESRRMRFFGVSRNAPRQAADRLCGEESPGLLALGAWVGEELVGEADCAVLDDLPETAELALAVADRWHHRGVGTLFLEHLVHAARACGVRFFEADTLAGNQAVHKVFADLGLPVQRRFAQSEVRIRVPLDESDERYRTAVDERGRRADVASLAALLRPASVALVGVSRREGSVGRAVLGKIRRGGFTGAVWAVNPHAAEIDGVTAYPSVAALPAVLDLAVLAVPAAAVGEVAEDCGAAGVRALVVLTSGLGPEDARRLMRACWRYSMRLVGPNSLGLAQADPAVRLDAEFGAVFPRAGTAGVAVQSGGVGIALLERLGWLGVGVSSFVSLSDKYDVSGNDLLRWWEADGRTDLALFHLEAFGSPRAFARTVRRVTRTIPVLTVDAGRSTAGRRGAASHTAAAARALAHARDRARWLAEPRSEPADAVDCDRYTARSLVDGYLTAHPEGGWLDPLSTADLLESYGLPLTTSVWARDEHTAVAAAAGLRRLGHEGKVALKAYWPGQVHKSAVGAVRTGLATDIEARDAYHEFTRRFGVELAGAVVQPMAVPGLELLAGVVQDRVFGPLVVLGLGGTATDVLADQVARLAPLSEHDLTAMVAELRSAPLLFGQHGGPSVDLVAVRSVLARLSRLADDFPELVEADLNPVIVRPDGAVCVDARVRLEPRPSFDPYLRRLRRPAAAEGK
ncbi:GNAT family N-acetyltransferase [Kitasatospora sp. NPDC056531]|uniref:GNAT family N-acetyltransferase n=1 Tax=Kitasatospora sp. NPDC056531 TaxID=3345856 RepID=UPI003692C6A7